MQSYLYISTPWGCSIIAAAAVLDFILGDREDLPHPVRILGSAIAHGERFCRKLPLNPVFQGGVLTLSIIFLSYGLTYAGIILFGMAGNLAAWLFSVMVIYFCISLKCLADEAMAVKTALEKDGIEAARSHIARLVGRDTSNLDERQVAMAAIETVAENFVDSLTAPIFYACLGGPALCAAYRAVNTLDAMIGYKNDRYLQFGKLAARIDDAANWIPARLSVVAVCAASRITGIGSRGDIRRVVRRDCRCHSSPNSGFTESAFAAALNVRVGGPATYQGKTVEYPWINQEAREPEPADIARAVKLLYAASAVAILFVTAAGMGLCYMFTL